MDPRDVAIAESFEQGLHAHQQGRLDSAEVKYRAVLARAPDHVDALHFLGLLAFQLGRSDEAEELIRSALSIDGSNAQAYANLGTVYLARGDAISAADCFRRALCIAPAHTDAVLRLADALIAQREYGDAIVLLRKAVERVPEDARVHQALGNAVLGIGDARSALPSLQRAAQLAAGSASAQCDVGNCLLALNRSAEAAVAYEQAIRIEPGMVAAHYNLGIASRKLHQAERAIDSFGAAIALRPELAESHYGLGHALRDADRTEEARACFERALSLNPDFVEARWSRVMSCLPSVLEHRADTARVRAVFARELSGLSDWFAGARAASGHRAVGVQQPFALAYQDESNLEPLQRHGALCVRLMDQSPHRRLMPTDLSRPAAKPLRVGIVSEHFHEHSVWSAIVKGWIGQLDRGRLALYAFHLGVDQDAETGYARSSATHFECGPKTLDQWIASILHCAPDVLVYPDIGMEATTLKLASLRLAPVQAASWGHPETTGLPSIDYYISAQDLEPAGAQAHYSERLVTLPRLGVYFEPVAVAPIMPDLSRWDLDAAAPLFICAGTPFKYAPMHDHVLPRIARQVRNCRFLFFEHWTSGLSAKLRRRLTQAFSEAGLDADRYLRFVPWQTRQAFHGLMRSADALLDTIGFSGFNTALQAIQCDLPVVTCEGRFLRGRLASGILRRSGLDELVAAGADDYVALGVRLVSDRAYNAGVRERMRLGRHLLYRDPLPIRALEEFLLRAARR